MMKNHKRNQLNRSLHGTGLALSMIIGSAIFRLITIRIYFMILLGSCADWLLVPLFDRIIHPPAGAVIKFRPSSGRCARSNGRHLDLFIAA